MTNASPSFDLLDAKVRRWVWKQGWGSLNQLQEEAIPKILPGDRDIILAAPTAGGKTEAAFLPVISKLCASPEALCLCVSPLKALINDQYDRLSLLCDDCGVPAYKWHGDAPQSLKRRFISQRCGLLLITPESLEAMLVRRGGEANAIFNSLKFVVVDELHVFFGSERGKQLQSLLHRVEVGIGRCVPRIALSATLGDEAAASRFLRPTEAVRTEVVSAGRGGRDLKLLQRGYRQTDDGRLIGSNSAEVGGDADASDYADPVSAELFRVMRGTDNLVFANSRQLSEEFGDRLRQLSEEAGVPNEFLVHHGSLGKEVREPVEQRLKDSRFPTTVFATTTLEMGIDVGSVQSIAQIGVPPSVASLTQRLGRSGRSTGTPSILRTYVAEPDATDGVGISDALRVATVQVVAMTELLIEKRVEPPENAGLHLSTLIQQLLAVIAQYGGITAKDGWDVLCGGGVFELPGTSTYFALLKAMGGAGLITQMRDGLLVLGVVGERLVEHYDFFAAFFAPDELTVMHQGQSLGRISPLGGIARGSYIVLTGRRWEVTDVDVSVGVVQVRPARGGRAPRFEGRLPDVHTLVRQKMHGVYGGRSVPPYLDSTARMLLDEGRAAFRRNGLADAHFIGDGSGARLFPWVGDRELRTIGLALRMVDPGLEFESVSLCSNLSKAGLERACVNLIDEGFPPATKLLQGWPLLPLGKYDHFLSDELLREEIAATLLDTEAATRALRAILG